MGITRTSGTKNPKTTNVSVTEQWTSASVGTSTRKDVVLHGGGTSGGCTQVRVSLEGRADVTDSGVNEERREINTVPRSTVQQYLTHKHREGSEYVIQDCLLHYHILHPRSPPLNQHLHLGSLALIMGLFLLGSLDRTGERWCVYVSLLLSGVILGQYDRETRV